MIIVISQRVDFISKRNEIRDSVDQKLLRLICDIGPIPVQVPNVLLLKNDTQNLTNWLNHINPGGLILSGGNDIGEYVDRDATEELLYKWARNNEKPILGICRGMQMIGLLNDVELKKVSNHVNVKHLIISKQKQKKTRNSFHNYSLTKCPKGFEVLFTSEDGEIESIKHETKNIFGIMWHPERELPFLIDDLKFINSIFND